MAWFRKSKIQERDESRVEFLGEQDGEVERKLKAHLVDVFAQFPALQRAYLARVGFEPGAPPTVTLCLASDLQDPAILEAARRQFASMFAADTFLDMLFLTPAQEADVARVCQAFYKRLSYER
ncbi:MAG TPA: hypothetical protein VF118_08190 [Gemmatimonadaceae bacterium]